MLDMRSALAAYVVGCAWLAAQSGAVAQASKPAARDSQTIQSCVKAASGDTRRAEQCIERIAGPCLKQPKAQSTAGMVECAARETAVWDDILNETFRRLRDKLEEADQKAKLRDMQRAWIESRDRTCGFYDVYHQGGTIARPMAALCVNNETARRALFLLNFLEDAEGN